MFAPRPTSPLSCESLPDISSEDVICSMDSEDEMDDAARAAKRRRIEKLGRDYLEGKQLTIISASLKGPFEDGWVNPWKKRTRSRKAQKTLSSTAATKGAAAGEANELEIVPKKTRRDSRQNSRSATRGSHPRSTSRGNPHVPDSDTAQRQRSNEQLRVPSIHDRSLSHVSGPSGSSTGSSSKRARQGTPDEAGRTKKSRYSDTEWLKRDGKGLHRRVVNPARSPSPTPASRPPSRQKSVPDGAQTQRDGENNGAGPVIHSPTTGFTPVNRYKHPPKDSAPVEKNSTTNSGVPADRDQPDHRDTSSTFSKPLAPASAKTRNPDPKMTTNNPRSFSAPQALSSDSQQPHVPTEGNNTKTQQSQSKNLSTKEKPKSENATGHREVNEPDPVISKGHSKPKSKPSSRQNSYALNSAPTESGQLPSAQILPENTKFSDIPLSLAYTAPPGSAEGSGEAPTKPEMGDKHISTEAGAAQNVSRDGDANPKDPADYSSDSRSPVEITPFHTFSIDSANSESHTLANCSFKHTANAVSFEETESRVIEQRGTKDAGRPTDSRAKAQLTHRVENGTAPAPSTAENPQTHTSTPPAGNASYESSGTALPFTLTMSTDGTRRHQDGQGNAAELHEFNLKEALRDAGTFLESYRIDRDTTFQSHKDTSSQGRVVQPTTGTDNG